MTHICKNCGSPVKSRFCSDCGQPASTHRISGHFLWHDIQHGILHVDKGILFTAKELFTRPGHSIREFLQGKRVKHFKPISLVIILAGIYGFLSHYFHIDLSGKRIYQENYFYVGDYKDGYACVKANDGWKHINSKGADLNNKIFEDLGIFHKNYATAKDLNGWFHIDKDGVNLYSKRFHSVEPFYNGFSLVEDFNKQKSVINESGEITCLIP